MREKVVAAIVLSMLVIVVLSVQPARAHPLEKIIVGFSMPLNAGGPIPLTAMMHHLYYFMLIDDYNATGGLYVPEYGKKLPVDYLMLVDDYTAEKTIANYLILLEMLQRGEIQLIFAPWSTARNVEVIPFFEAAHVPLVGLTVGSNTIHNNLKNDVWNWFFVTLGQPCEDAEELVEVIQHINTKVNPSLRIDKVGFGYRDDEHGVEHMEAIRDKLLEAGITVIWEDLDYDSENPPTDWTDPWINTFVNEDVDVVIMCGYAEVAGFIRQCIDKDINFKGIVVGPALETPFFVYQVFGFTYGEFAGIMYYNGFPANSYDKEPYWSWARVKHPQVSTKHVGFPFLPFPASADFYMGVEALFQAVENVGLNYTAIRDALEFWTFNLTLGGWTTSVGKPPISYKFRQSEGKGPIVGDHGTITQWQGEVMMDVIWPPQQASTDWIIYPKFPWSWAQIPDLIRDGAVEIGDVARVSYPYGADPTDPRWDPVADVNGDGVIEIADVAEVCWYFGTIAPSGGVVSY